MATCEFETTFNVDQYQTDSWECKEKATEDSQYCIWHKPSEEKSVEELIEAKKNVGVSEVRFPDFSGLNFAEMDLSDWNFMHADFDGANLSSADMSGAMFDHSSFVDANLEKADLTNARLNATDFENSDLRWADLRGAMVGFAYFGDADLRNIQHHEFQPCFVSDAVLEQGKTPSDLMAGSVNDLPNKAIETLPWPALKNYKKANRQRAAKQANFLYKIVSDLWQITTSMISLHWIYHAIKGKGEPEEPESDEISSSQTDLSDFEKNENQSEKNQ